MLTVTPIEAFTDNYIWLIQSSQSQYCAIVDPGDENPVLKFLAHSKLKLAAILLTHHHFDHTGGTQAILTHHHAMVYGPKHERIPTVTHPLKENDEIELPQLNIRFHILDIPGHTSGHIAYHGEQMLYCGDTLFAGGCGRLFEGSAKQMYRSLEKIQQLPDNTKIYCGHEYTEKNLRFASMVEPQNQDIINRLHEVTQLRQQDLPTLPTTIALEKKTNPFFRCHDAGVKKAAENRCHQTLSSPIDVFAEIRKWKDTF